LNKGSRKSWLLLGERSLNRFFGQNKGDEYGLAASAVVGGESGEAVAAVDQLFDVEEQELILRHSERSIAVGRSLRMGHYRAESASTVSLKPTALVTAANVDNRGFPCFDKAR